MKKLYFIKEANGKWNFTLCVNGKKVLNSANQGYSRKTDCEKVAIQNVKWDAIVRTTRKEFNALFKK